MTNLKLDRHGFSAYSTISLINNQVGKDKGYEASYWFTNKALRNLAKVLSRTEDCHLHSVAKVKIIVAGDVLLSVSLDDNDV